jgi:hypothetical protein
MKRPIKPFILIIAVLFVSITVVTSCGNKNADKGTEENHHAGGDTTHHHENMPMDSTQTVYACPMHPEITGKDGDKCSKCGMKLEAVKD